MKINGATEEIPFSDLDPYVEWGPLEIGIVQLAMQPDGNGRIYVTLTPVGGANCSINGVEILPL